jgi:hypothetical protein
MIEKDHSDDVKIQINLVDWLGVGKLSTGYYYLKAELHCWNDKTKLHDYTCPAIDSN